MQPLGSEVVSHKGLSFKKLYNEEMCARIIDDIAQKINAFYHQLEQETNDGKPIEVVALCLLKGAFMFYTDVVRKLNIKLVCDFVKISSYKGEKSTGEITIEGGFNFDKFKDKHILIIEDMADTGLTLSKFRTLLLQAQPKSLKIAVLVNRPDKPKDFPLDWIGLECSDFIIGYGLDYDQFGRTFPGIYQKA